jgi:hypothetical protein
LHSPAPLAQCVHCRRAESFDIAGPAHAVLAATPTGVSLGASA